MTEQECPSCSLMEMVIFVGLQAAGKSTFYQTRFAATHALVSKDRFRHNKNRARRQGQLNEEALQEGRSVIVDNTNPTVEDRAPLIALARAHGAHGARVAGYYFHSTADESLARNREREGIAHVPAVAIYATRKKLVPPTYAEGFDVLYDVRIVRAGAFDVRERLREI